MSLADKWVPLGDARLDELERKSAARDVFAVAPWEFDGMCARIRRAEGLCDQAVAAAQLALAWMHDPAENIVERFDRVADEFNHDTGFTRPGRSTPLAMGGQDHEAARAAWEQWCLQRSEAVRTALMSFVAAARGGA